MLISGPFIERSDIAKALVELEGSTTLYLEKLKNKRLRVLIERQEHGQAENEDFIYRETRLYFSSSERPSLFCISRLHAGMLSSAELHLILHSEMPLGLIFIQNNPPGLVRKANLATREEENADVGRKLHVAPGPVYRKSYEYWIGDREVGTIVEFFTGETLLRS